MEKGNTIAALNEQLFSALKNLNTELKGDALKEEISKAREIANIGKVIVDNSRLALDAMKMVQDGKAYATEVKGLLG